MMAFYSWEATKDVQKISYTCMDEYGSGTTHANYDVMYAMAKGQTKDMNNGIVKFNFKHILSQVVFKAKTQYDNMQVDIDVIKIHNFKFAGAFTLPAAADGTGSWSSSDLAFPHAFTVVKNANITVNSNTEATDITTNTPMLNIPQELTAWKVPKQPPKASWRPIMRSNVIWRSPAKSGSPELICWVQQANTKQFMFRSEIHGNRASVISTR